ncbi:catalase-related domain-containing protein [Niabella ginsengisoli]
MRMQINKGKASYTPNSIGGGCPYLAKAAEGFTSHQEKIDGQKIRGRSKSFFDHFSQAKLFYNSQSEPEKNHIKDALSFELSKCIIPAIRERMVNNLSNVDLDLASYVAAKIGLPQIKNAKPVENGAIPADGNPKDYKPLKGTSSIKRSAALSMAGTVKDSIVSRKIAILATDGVDEKEITKLKKH